MDDAEFQRILSSAATGERRALTVLYGRYHRMLVRFLRAEVPGLGEELEERTWLELSRTPEAFAGDERTFRVRLLSIARRQVQQIRYSSDATPRPAAPDLVDLVGDEPVADAAIAELLHGLHPKETEILLLRVVGGLTAEETGKLLRRDAQAVRAAEQNALDHIARRLRRQQRVLNSAGPTASLNPEG